MIRLQDLGGKVRVINSHEGHQGTVRGTAVNAKGELIRVAVRCECGAALWMKPEWVERVGP